MIQWVHIQHAHPNTIVRNRFDATSRRASPPSTADTSGLFSAAMRHALYPRSGTIISAGKHRGDQEQLRDLV